jgi:glutathione S-transferase
VRARGFVTRVCLRKAQGAAFVDHRHTFAEWAAVKASGVAPLGQLPILEVEGGVYTQSIPQSAYAAKLAGLYPSTPLDALKADEIVAVIDECWNKLGGTPKDAAARVAYAEEVAPKYLALLAKRLGAGPFFGGAAEPQWADLWLFAYMRIATAGFFDHVPQDFVARHAPALAAHFEAVKASALYKSFGTPE